MRRLAAGELALDHNALDQLPSSRTIEHLRGLLITSGCLPARDPHLAGYERWLATKLDTIVDQAHRQTIDRFARWHLLRQLRENAARASVTDGAFLNAKQTTTVAIEFLTWTANRGTELRDLSQHDVDAWFASGPTTRKHAVRFLYWARDQQLIAQLEIPAPRTNETRLLGSTQRLAVLQRVLTDHTIQPSHALVACLVLLFGTTLDQIAKLQLDDAFESTDGTRIRLGAHPVLLPDPVAQLLHRHLADPRYQRNTATNASSVWLFPGARPGRPMHLNT